MTTNKAGNTARSNAAKQYGRGISLVTWGFLFFLWVVPTVFAEGKIVVSGITEPIKDVTLSLEIAGSISKIFHKEGARIKKGQLLLKLNQKLEVLEVERRKLIWESKAELTSAMERQKTLKSLFDSTKTLFETTKAVSREEVEKMELEYKLAVAERLRLEMTEEKERIEYEMALESLKRREIRSPIKGIITELLLDEGETCEPRQPLIHVVDITRCRFLCNMEEGVGRNLKKDQPVMLRIQTGDSYTDKKGVIVFASPVVDSASGLLHVIAEFDNRDGKVRPGVPGTMQLDSH